MGISTSSAEPGMVWSVGAYTATSGYAGTTTTSGTYDFSVDPATGTISMPFVGTVTTPGTITTSPLTYTTTPLTFSGTWTSIEPTMGNVEFDMETKTLKVYNGAEWVEVKMHDYVPLTEKEVEEKELSTIQDQIKKEIYGA